jgi:hypothetical protein
MGYNETDFIYSDRTSRWAGLLPPWLKIASDSLSVGQQYMNAIALTADELESSLNQALNNQYVGTSNIGEIDWVYKMHYARILSPTASHTVRGRLTADGYYTTLKVCDSLREFYGTSLDTCIFDFEKNIMYARQPFVTIEIDGTEDPGTTSIHHVWNCFDELAMLLGIYRRTGETNAELKDRILNVFRYPASSTKMGVIFGMAGQLGLVKTALWGVEDTYILPEPAYPESIRIDTRFPKPQEYTVAGDTVTLKKELFVFYDKGSEYSMTGCKVENGVVSILGDLSKGSITTPTLYVDNLIKWNLVNGTYFESSTASITIDILQASDDIVIAEGLAFGSPIAIQSDIPEDVSYPIKIRINLSRPDYTYESPTVSEVRLTYSADSSTVTYIPKSSISLDAMYDEEYRNDPANGLFNSDGSPTPLMLKYVRELSDVSPILWDEFKWDEAYWDVVDKDLMGLDVLPNKWDPNIGLIANEYLQIGIGDGLDLKVKQGEDWKLRIHSGSYFTGPNLDESYLYATEEVVENAGPISELTISGFPEQGAPIVVSANGKFLTHVSFLDDGYEYTLENKEVFEYDGSGNCDLYLAYPGYDILSVAIVGNCYVDSLRYTELENSGGAKNILPITGGQAEETITVYYKIKDSFIAVPTDDGFILRFSEPQSNIKITYEKASDNIYYTEDSVSLDPSKTHLTQGFVYLTSEKMPVSSINVVAYPGMVISNGVDRCIIHADCLDIWENPVLGETLTATPKVYDASGNLLGTWGSIDKITTSGNRTTFRLTASSGLGITAGTKIVSVEITNGSVTGKVDVKVR